MKKIQMLILFAVMLLAVSCIYPFSADIEREEGEYMVIEGDILIGAESSITLSYLAPLSGLDFTLAAPKGRVWIESEEGKGYEGFYSAEESRRDGLAITSVYKIDTRRFSAATRYKLHVRCENNGREYVTDWLSVEKAPVLDEIKYVKDESSGSLRFLVSLHSDSGQQYFRSHFHEVWEYVAPYRTEVKFVTGSDYPGGYKIVDFEGDENTYYCWDNADSYDVMLMSTAGLTKNTVIDHDFYQIARDNRKLSQLYSMEYSVVALSDEAYAYWYNMNSVTTNVGNLFSPNPSELRGNITCIQDPSEMVYGFISAAEVTRTTLWYDNVKESFFKPERGCTDVIEVPDMQANRYYNTGWRPAFYSEADGIYFWVQASCADCTRLGGTKNRPKDWPSPSTHI